MAFALNTANDIFSEKGRIKRVVGSAQVVQNVRTRLLTYLGECFLDKTRGVPYFEKIFVKPTNLSTVETILKNVILRTPGILELTYFEMSFTTSNRFLSVSFGANTIDGDAIETTVNTEV